MACSRIFQTGEVFADRLRNEVGLAFDREMVHSGVQRTALIDSNVEILAVTYPQRKSGKLRYGDDLFLVMERHYGCWVVSSYSRSCLVAFWWIWVLLEILVRNEERSNRQRQRSEKESRHRNVPHASQQRIASITRQRNSEGIQCFEDRSMWIYFGMFRFNTGDQRSKLYLDYLEAEAAITLPSKRLLPS